MKGFVLGAKREPEWIELSPGLEAAIRPYDALAWQMARAEAFQRSDANATNAEVVGKIAIELGVLLIAEWRGVAAADGGDAEPTPDAIREVLLCVPGALDALQRHVAAYFEVEASKKTSKNAPGGSPKRAARNTAKAAGAKAAPALAARREKTARSARSRGGSRTKPSASGSSLEKGSTRSAPGSAEPTAST